MIIEAKVVERPEERIIQFPRRLKPYELVQANICINSILGPPRRRWSYVNELPPELAAESQVIKIIIFKEKGINNQLEEALQKASLS